MSLEFWEAVKKLAPLKKTLFPRRREKRHKFHALFEFFTVSMLALAQVFHAPDRRFNA
jgi:hypothetical protein